MLLKHKQVK